MCYLWPVSRKREGRQAVHLWLPIPLVQNVDSRIGELGPDRTAVIELILTRYWNRPQIEIKDRARK